MNYSALKVGSWDLAGLVRDPAGDDFKQFLNSIEGKVRDFESKRSSLRPDIPAAEFEGFIHAIEEIYEKVSVASGYAHLRYYANTASNEASALVTRMEKMGADISNRLLFFDLWFKKGIGEQDATRLINAVPAVYRQYLEHKRLLAKHSLSEPEERIINTLEVTGTGALVKIYDKMASGFEFEMKVKKGKKTIVKKFDNKEKLVSFVRSANPAEREAAYRALFEVYKKNSGVLGRMQTFCQTVSSTAGHRGRSGASFSSLTASPFP